MTEFRHSIYSQETICKCTADSMNC